MHKGQRNFWKFCGFGKQRQIADLALKIEKLKTKSNALAPLYLKS